jgi:hypothetical protein
MAVLAWLTPAMALTTGGAAQVRFGDTDAIVQFQRAADDYAFLHRQVERRLGQMHRPVADPIVMAAAMREARPDPAEGELLKPAVAAVIRARLARAVQSAGCEWPEPPTSSTLYVHDSARDTEPLPACLLDVLPKLPEELEFRSAGAALVLVDTHADLVVDLISGLFGTTVF